MRIRQVRGGWVGIGRGLVSGGMLAIVAMMGSMARAQGGETQDTVAPVRVSSGVMAGNLVKRVDPVMPASVHVNGAVVMRLVISKTGAVEQVEAISGPADLRPIVVDAVRQWQYRPYLLNGEPVEVETTITWSMQFGGRGSGMMGDAASHPRVISAPNPEYTQEARKKKVAGNVLVSLTVDEQGLPTHVKVLRGLGSGLDEKAVEAVEGYRFRPAMKDGKAVATDLHIEVNFQIF